MHLQHQLPTIILHQLIFTPVSIYPLYNHPSSTSRLTLSSFSSVPQPSLKQRTEKGATMRNKASSLFIWALIAAMLSQNLVIPVISTTLDDQKHYYTPDPGTGTPPPSSHGGSYGSPPHHHTPSHGSYNPSPSPPTNCGTPPSRPSTPTPSRPSTPSTPTYGTPPSTPSNPPVIITPPTPIIGTPPTIPIIGTPPTIPTIGTPPTIPIIGAPPFDPGFPGIPTPPYLPDPNSPPFTCTYWRNHPTVIWGLVGWWATMGHAFGLTSLPGLGSSTMNLHQALSNTRTDGLGELYREGTAALLNSMVDNRFHFTTTQVRDSFVKGLGSNKAAKNQARLFRLANEDKLKPRA